MAATQGEAWVELSGSGGPTLAGFIRIAGSTAWAGRGVGSEWAGGFGIGQRTESAFGGLVRVEVFSQSPASMASP